MANHATPKKIKKSVPDTDQTPLGYPNISKRDRSRDSNSDEDHVIKTSRHSVSHTSASSASVSHTSASSASVPPSTRSPSPPVSPSVDINMDEEQEDDLQGASRTTGGRFRGNAQGNALNMADLSNYSYYLNSE